MAQTRRRGRGRGARDRRAAQRGGRRGVRPTRRGLALGVFLPSACRGNPTPARSPRGRIHAMAKLQLTFASALYDRMQPIYTGEVPVDGVELNFIRIEQPRPIFDRMSGGQEFDVAEYSSSEYVQRYASTQ